MKKIKYFWKSGVSYNNFDSCMKFVVEDRDKFIGDVDNKIIKIDDEEFINLVFNNANIIMLKLTYFTEK